MLKLSNWFMIWLKSPDGNSTRVLCLKLPWKKYSFCTFCKLKTWKKGEQNKLEKFFSKHNVYPEW